MIIQIERQYHDLVDCRSYQIKECLKKKQDLIFVVGNQRMTIPYKDIRKRQLKIHKQRFQSKFYPDQYYTLISFAWKPDKKLTTEEYFKKYNIL